MPISSACPDRTLVGSRLARRMRAGLRRGFTLIEILVVAALIALFSGIAIFSVQQMYDANRAKAMIGEAFEIGTSLSFAYNDIGFFPKLHLLNKPLSLVTFESGTNTVAYPSFDTYGYLVPGDVRGGAIMTKWKGPYWGASEMRSRGAQGGSGLGYVRLVGTGTNVQIPTGENLSLVRWPFDTWGNPWVFYQVVADPGYASTGNPKGLRLIRTPGEGANYFNAVVSYGEDGMPGGGWRTSNPTAAVIAEGEYARLFAVGDAVAGGPALFTIKSIDPTAGEYALGLDAAFSESLAFSIDGNANNPDPTSQVVGIRVPGSDDVIFSF